MNKKNKFGGLNTICLPDLLYSYRESDVSRENKRNKSTKQNREPEIDPHKYDHLNFSKETEAMQWRKDKHSNQRSGKNWTDTCKKKSRHIPYILLQN